MFVIIADQIGSSTDEDRVAGALTELGVRFGADYPLAPERTAGDELQALTPNARAALETALHLLRARHWRVGLGIGDVRTPLPASIREAAGSGFNAARAAIDAAERRPTRFAIQADAPRTRAAEHLQPLIDLLLAGRERWSEQGWELHDLLEQGGTQAGAAERLRITPQAASKRARAANLRIDADARAALVDLLAETQAGRLWEP